MSRLSATSSAWKTKKSKKNSSQGVQFRARLTRSPAELVPDRTQVELTYFDQFSLNPAVNTPDNYVFRANSLFDPNLTGTGHQPLSYDQWTTFYSNWVVTRCVAKATIMSTSLSTTAPTNQQAIFAMTPRRNDATPIAVLSTALEQAYTEWTPVVGYAKPPTLGMTIDCAKFFGVKPSVYNSSLEYSGGIGANPTQVLHLVCLAGDSLEGTTNADPLYVTIEFVFTAHFYNAITLAAS